MTQIVITGGKGGCGKTTVAASLAYLAEGWVIADCDVDSPNLGILACPAIEETHPYTASNFNIELNRCTRCGLCIDKCAFGAIRDDFVIDPYLCENCSLCAQICPVDAITEKEGEIGHWRAGESRFGPFLDAYLHPGAENSGKLVTLLREEAQKRAETNSSEGILIDGPPGVGCPVIASITGTDLAIAVAEPTVSGIHDVRRIVELTSTLETPISIVINKADLSQANVAELRAFAEENGIEILGELPYEKLANVAQSNMKTLAEFAPDSHFAIEMLSIWNKIRDTIGAAT